MSPPLPRARRWPCLRRALAAIALVATLWIGWQNLNTVGRALLVAIVAATAAYLLSSDGEPGDNSWDDGEAGAGDSD
jgi:hypothetical protein